MSDLVSLEGAIVLRKGKLTLRIPLAAGGDKLAPSAKGIGKIEGEFLNVIIQPWLAQKLCIGAGDMVMVDNREGTFNITRSSSHPSALSTRRVGTSCLRQTRRLGGSAQVQRPRGRNGLRVIVHTPVNKEGVVWPI